MIRTSPVVWIGTAVLSFIGIAAVASAYLAGGAGGDNDSPKDVEVRATERGALWPPPESVEEFADRMTSVVVGRYVDIIDVREMNAGSDAVGANALMPVTLMRFEADRYLVGTGPSSLVIGQYGDIPAGYTLFGVPAPNFGEEITMIVTPWSLNSSINHPVFNTYGRLVERDGAVQYAFVTQDLLEELPLHGIVPFAEGRSLAEVQAQLQEVARDRGLFVPD